MTLFEHQQIQAILFPGIGVKPFGKERDFFLRYRTTIQPYLEAASESVKIDLVQSLENQTTFEEDQPAREVFAYSFSCGTFDVLRRLGLTPSYLAGHSLGVYAALVAAEAIDFPTGLRITVKALKLGKTCCPEKKFGVVVIIGLDHKNVLDIIAERNYSSINLANLNNNCSGVYVGLQHETDALLTIAEQLGAIKTIRLRIDNPYHHPGFMEGTAREFRSFLGEMGWRRPSCPVLSALDHTICDTVESLIDMTTANIAQPIHWPGVLGKLHTLGIESVIECGVGVSLSQHARFIEPAPRHYNLKNLRRRLDY